MTSSSLVHVVSVLNGEVDVCSVCHLVLDILEEWQVRQYLLIQEKFHG